MFKIGFTAALALITGERMTSGMAQEVARLLPRDERIRLNQVVTKVAAALEARIKNGGELTVLLFPED